MNLVSLTAQLGSERRGGLGSTADDADLGQLAHAGDGTGVGPCLDTSADDRQDTCIGPRKVAGGNRGCRRGADLGYAGAVHESDRRARPRVVQCDGRQVRRQPQLRIAMKDADRLVAEADVGQLGGHQRQDAGAIDRWQAQANRLDRLAAGEPGERLLHGLDAVAPGQESRDVIAAQDSNLHRVRVARLRW